MTFDKMVVGIDARASANEDTFVLTDNDITVIIEKDSNGYSAHYKCFAEHISVDSMKDGELACITALAKLSERAEATREIFWHFLHAYNDPGMGLFRAWLRNAETNSTCL